MKRNTVLITAVLFCFAGFAMAAEQEPQSKGQAQKAQEEAEVARNDAKPHIDSVASNKGNCVPKGEKSTPKTMQNGPEGDPQASQNQVEYGGGG
jgi:hypothetical protein